MISEALFVSKGGVTFVRHKLVEMGVLQNQGVMLRSHMVWKLRNSWILP